jgi:hypothetical protein
MTNKQNVEPIVDRLLSYLKEAPIEAGSRKELVHKISNLSENFAPNQNWYVRTMNKLFEIGGDQIKEDLINKFIWSISEYERDENGEKFRESTIKIYVKILKKNPNIPDALLQVIAWILGEYGSQLNDGPKVSKILNLLAQFTRGTYENERTRAFILLALTKLHCALNFNENNYVQNIMIDYLASRNLEVQQRAFDYRVLSEAQKGGKNISGFIFKTPLTEQQVNEEHFDFNLAFLDGFVQQERQAGKAEWD